MTHAYGVEETVGRSSRLDRVLSELVAQVPEIEAASVVSFDGLPMAAALPPGMDEDRVAAMSAALLSLGERAAEGLGRGELSQVYVEGENGTVFLVSAEDEGVLVAVAAKGAKVGLMLFEVRRAAEAVASVLRVEPLLAAVDDLDEAEPVVAVVAVPEAVARPVVRVVASVAPAAPVDPVDTVDLAPVAPATPVPPAVVRELEEPPTFFAPAYADATPDGPAYDKPAYDQPAYDKPAYVAGHLPDPAYQPVLEAFGPLAPPLHTAPVATPASPASISWFAAETILPGASTGATNPSNWG